MTAALTSREEKTKLGSNIVLRSIIVNEGVWIRGFSYLRTHPPTTVTRWQHATNHNHCHLSTALRTRLAAPKSQSLPPSGVTPHYVITRRRTQRCVFLAMCLWYRGRWRRGTRLAWRVSSGALWAGSAVVGWRARGTPRLWGAGATRSCSSSRPCPSRPLRDSC